MTLRKTIAFLLAFTLLAETAFAHQIAANVWEERKLSPPNASIGGLYQKNRDPRLQIAGMTNAWGSIRKTLHPAGISKGNIYHIQDVHLNQEAQRHIAETIQLLAQSGKIVTVALEGAFGPLDLSRLQTFPDRTALRRVSDYFLNRKEISGAAYAVLNTPELNAIGIDDRVAYDANVAAYKASAPKLEAIKQELSASRKNLEAKKQLVLNPELAKFDADVEAYRQGRFSLGAYLRNFEGGTEIQRFKQAFLLETTLDFAQVQQAVKRKDLRSPLLKDYMEYVALAQSIDVEALLAETQTAENKKFTALAHTANENNLIRESRRQYLTEKLVDFALTKTEWDEYKQMHAAWGMEIMEKLHSFERFYFEAEARDEKMTQNIINVMRHATCDMPNAVLVTGGFHTKGIDTILTKAGYTVHQFVPKITKVDAAGGSAYLSVFMQEKSPLEKIFEGKKLFLTQEPVTAFTSQIKIPAALVLDDKTGKTGSKKLRTSHQGIPLEAELVKNNGEIKSFYADVITAPKKEYLDTYRRSFVGEHPLRLTSRYHVLQFLFNFRIFQWAHFITGRFFQYSAVILMHAPLPVFITYIFLQGHIVSLLVGPLLLIYYIKAMLTTNEEKWFLAPIRYPNMFIHGTYNLVLRWVGFELSQSGKKKSRPIPHIPDSIVIADEIAKGFSVNGVWELLADHKITEKNAAKPKITQKQLEEFRDFVVGIMNEPTLAKKGLGDRNLTKSDLRTIFSVYGAGNISPELKTAIEQMLVLLNLKALMLQTKTKPGDNLPKLNDGIVHLIEKVLPTFKHEKNNTLLALMKSCIPKVTSKLKRLAASPLKITPGLLARRQYFMELIELFLHEHHRPASSFLELSIWINKRVIEDALKRAAHPTECLMLAQGDPIKTVLGQLENPVYLWINERVATPKRIEQMFLTLRPQKNYVDEDDDELENIPSPPALVEDKNLEIDLVYERMKKLKPQEKEFILRLFGLPPFIQAENAAEIARSMGLSRERVRQVKIKALSKLRGEPTEPPKKTAHLPHYLWVHLKRKLERAYNDKEISHEEFDRIVTKKLGVARIDNKGEIFYEAVGTELLAEVLTEHYRSKDIRKEVTLAEVIAYLEYHENLHLKLREMPEALYSLFVDLKDPAIYKKEWQITGFATLKHYFSNNYGFNFMSDIEFVEELLVVHMTENDRLGQNVRLLMDKQLPEYRSDLPVGVQKALEKAAATFKVTEPYLPPAWYKNIKEAEVHFEKYIRVRPNRIQLRPPVDNFSAFSEWLGPIVNWRELVRNFSTPSTSLRASREPKDHHGYAYWINNAQVRTSFLLFLRWFFQNPVSKSATTELLQDLLNYWHAIAVLGLDSGRPNRVEAALANQRKFRNSGNTRVDEFAYVSTQLNVSRLSMAGDIVRQADRALINDPFIEILRSFGNAGTANPVFAIDVPLTRIPETGEKKARPEFQHGLSYFYPSAEFHPLYIGAMIELLDEFKNLWRDPDAKLEDAVLLVGELYQYAAAPGFWLETTNSILMNCKNAMLRFGLNLNGIEHWILDLAAFGMAPDNFKRLFLEKVREANTGKDFEQPLGSLGVNQLFGPALEHSKETNDVPSLPDLPRPTKMIDKSFTEQRLIDEAA